ncbi:ATP-grasp domain-containing protein [Billgrantia saliphila]|uniref:ATP-grasp domain-containing protein n=1 Tax=Billgrantia saliphila TaxID=1848458 RepID=UPI0018CC6728|nr:ATP-grasp domain-containing protein [Halomonas saliphila]
MNVLLTCAGRRNYLIAYFREALGGCGRLLAADCCAHAAALQEADEGFILPPVASSEYVEQLLALCASQNVKLVVPLNDHELPILAQARARFQEIEVEVLVSSPEVIELSADKLATVRFALSAGLQAPQTFVTLESAVKALEREDIVFPLIVKPRWGTASLGIEWVYDSETLELAWRLANHRLPRLGLRHGTFPGEGLLIQSVLPGREYGLDVINDLNGNYRATFVKRKLSMRAGETDRAITEARPELVDVGKRIGEALGHRGNLDCDIFYDGERVYLLDLNPRFGGGFPFSAEAGANMLSALIAWVRGEEPPHAWDAIRAGITSTKCDRLVRVNGSESRVRAQEARMAEPRLMPLVGVVGLNT